MNQFSTNDKLEIIKKALFHYKHTGYSYICSAIHKALHEFDTAKYNEFTLTRDIVHHNFIPLFIHHKPESVLEDAGWWPTENRTIRIKVFKEMIKTLEKQLQDETK